MSGSEGGGIETNRCFLPLCLLLDFEIQQLGQPVRRTNRCQRTCASSHDGQRAKIQSIHLAAIHRQPRFAAVTGVSDGLARSLSRCKILRLSCGVGPGATT
jgi:hypothetical protein